MSNENMADREYTIDDGRVGNSMPGSRIGGLGEMGGSMSDSPVFDEGDVGNARRPAEDQGNVAGAGTAQTIDVDDEGGQDVDGGLVYGASSDADNAEFGK